MIAVTVKLRILLLVLPLLSVTPAPAQHRHKRSHKTTREPLASVELEPAANPSNHYPVALRLIDGTLLAVDAASETPQGVWYTLRGVSYLIGRDRIKTIERGSEGPSTVEPPRVVATTSSTAPRPVWIFLMDGARLEVDNADESSAGVWYRRGSLAAFIERGRIDHLEREETKSREVAPAENKERGWSSGNAKIDALIKENGERYGVDPYLIFCVMEQESHFTIHSVSPKGARGLMQLMPGTSAHFGVRHPFSPAENISAGTRYLKQLIARFDGRIDLVLAGYNAGEGSVIRFGSRVPPYRETRNYVKQISYRYRRTNAQVVTAAGKVTPQAAPPKAFD